MWQKVKEKLGNHPVLIGIASGLIGMLFFVVSLFLFVNAKGETESEFRLEESTDNYLMEPAEEGESAESDNSEEADASVQSLYVDVKGAVHNPGVYQVTPDMRLMDAIELAGGFLISADQSQINLALKLVDQMVVYVPQVGEELKETNDESALIGGESEEEEGKININTADALQLQDLNGIGEKKADKIIQYREENGSFQSIDDLKNVSGIGDKTFEALKDFVVVGSQ